MRRRALWIAAAVAGCSIAGWFTYREGRAERARALGQQAERLLQPPFDEAPAFADIRATEARTLLDEARELAELPEFRVLEAEAAALEQLQRGDAAGARKALEAVAAPQPPSLQVLLAAVQLEAGDLDAAERTIGTLVGESPVAAPVAAAKDARPNENARSAFETAGRELRQAQEADGRVANRDRGGPIDAPETDTRAISAASRATGATDLRALAIASDVARAKGQGDRALAFAERGLAVRESAALLERRGLARELLGELRAAAADFERAAQLDSKLTSPLLHLGRVLRDLGETRAAVLAFSGAAQRNPKESEAWLGAGLCRIGLGDMSGARADLERAEELVPAKAAPLIALGDVDAAERNWDEAERHYAIATKLEPNMSLAWLKLGNTRMRKQQPSAAAEAYRKAIEQQAELAAAHNGLGAALQAQGDAEGARRELEQAAKLDPTDPNPLLNLARLYRQQGNETAAETALAQAQSRAPAPR